MPPAAEAAPVEIWTDGACKGNPGPGGWGALLCSGGKERELFGGARATTNNRMELTAVIEALRTLKRPCTVVIHTDSQYVMLGITQWLANWQRRGWMTADRKPVKNVELWKQLDEQVGRHKVLGARPHRRPGQRARGCSGQPRRRADARERPGR